jgi:isoleucyl-tRNA synthetase
MLFIVSEVELRPAPADVEAHAEAAPRITIERASGLKCERCWRYVPEVSTEDAWAGLCGRCQEALAEPMHG